MELIKRVIGQVNDNSSSIFYIVSESQRLAILISVPEIFVAFLYVDSNVKFLMAVHPNPSVDLMV
jgi:hypothetical protein